MTNVPPPKPNRKGPPPSAETVLHNLAQLPSSGLKPLNFRVSPEFHREFKTFAATQGRSMVEVLHEAFDLVREKHR
ncbi:MAG: hypothetical protein MI806_28195 [Minwuiales bacterium]|nr:hypothetical protein [Minwuiales bacterium]